MQGQDYCHLQNPQPHHDFIEITSKGRVLGARDQVALSYKTVPNSLG